MSKPCVRLDELNQLIKDKCLHLPLVSEKMGITTKTLNDKLTGITSFKCEEAGVLVNLLGLSAEDTMRIFLDIVSN